MARHGVKREDVFLACEQLVERGTTITVANVRNELGTGSYGTLLPLIREFGAREETASTSKGSGDTTVPIAPDQLSELARHLVGELWTQAASAAQTRITELEAAQAEGLSQLNALLSTRTAELEHAHADLTRLEVELAQTKQHRDDAVANASRLEIEITLVRTQAKEKDEEARRNLERAVSSERVSETRAAEAKQLYADLKAERAQMVQLQSSLLEGQKINAQKDGEITALRAQTKADREDAQRNLERALEAEKELALVQENLVETERPEVRHIRPNGSKPNSSTMRL